MPHASYLAAAGRLHADLLALVEKFPGYVGPSNNERAFALEQSAAAITELGRLQAEFASTVARIFADGAKLDTAGFEQSIRDAFSDLTGPMVTFADELKYTEAA